MVALEVAFNGFIMGIFYSLMAVGLSLIFGILKIVNFAHGEFYMIGGYIYVLATTYFGVNPLFALFFALLGGGLVGILTERLIMRPLYARYMDLGVAKAEYSIITTFGLSILLINVATVIFGPYAVKGPGLGTVERMRLGVFVIGGERIIASGIALLILIFGFWFIKCTMWGKKMQAVAQNRYGASIAAIDTFKVSMLTLALSGGLAASSGALLSPVFHVYPSVGLLPAVKSFIIVVLGGMGSIYGSIIAGLLLGVIESYGSFYISTAYKDAFGFLLLIIILIVRPWGLFGERVREV